MSRSASIERNTKETDIRVTLELDGTGQAELDTGIGFFDHMLDGFARHGLFDLNVYVDGDLDVDCHHTVEDTGIVLGNAIKEAVGDKKGIRRYGSCILPMDEALLLCAVDLSGRPSYVSTTGKYLSSSNGGMYHVQRTFRYRKICHGTYGTFARTFTRYVCYFNRRCIFVCMFKSMGRRFRSRLCHTIYRSNYSAFWRCFCLPYHSRRYAKQR